MHYLRAKQLAAVTGQPVQADGTVAPLPTALLELPAGTTLYAKASAGTWDVGIISYYKQAS